MTIQEYKASRGEWKPEAFNIKGNPESKKLLKQLVDKANIKSEGEALDFLAKYYQASQANEGKPKSKPAATEKSPREKELESLLTALEKKHTDKVSELNHRIAELVKKAGNADVLLTNPEYIKFKSETEEMMPKLFKDNSIDRVPISDEDFLTLLIDYAVRDPSKEFPFQEFAEKIYKKFKSQSNETGQVQQNQNKAEEQAGGETNGGAGDGTEDGNAPA